MNIFITGGSGYIGARLSFYLGSKGHKVSILCHQKPPINNDWNSLLTNIIVGDINKDYILDKIFETKPQAIIHLISLNQIDCLRDPKLIDTNVKSTYNLLMKGKNTGLKKFIYFSTVHVNGDDIFNTNKSHFNCTPKTPYGLTHLLSENICSYFYRTTNMDCISIRSCNSYGQPILKSKKSWNLVLNNLIKVAFFNKKIIIKSDGSAKRQFIHYKEICKTINNIIVEPKKGNKTIVDFNKLPVFSVKEIALIVQSVFLNRYNKNIPIYINENILWDGIEKKSNLTNNDFIDKINYIENLKKNINEMFQYLEKV